MRGTKLLMYVVEKSQEPLAFFKGEFRIVQDADYTERVCELKVNSAMMAGDEQ